MKDPLTDQPAILLFGGAFNPPHRTHRKILKAALAALPVDRAIILPSGRHPLKSSQDMAPDGARLEMCELAFGDLDDVTVSDIELRRHGVGYTVDTLRVFHELLPGERLFLLVGSDNLCILDSWHDHHALLRLATVVTYPRRGYDIDRRVLANQDLTEEEITELLRWVLEVEMDDVSATAIRAALRAGEVPPDLARAVAERIRTLGLYTA